MHTVEITKNGVEHGSVTFRGIVPQEVGKKTPAAASKERRLFRCSPTQCIPKAIARRIADSLSAGSRAGREEDYEWQS